MNGFYNSNEHRSYPFIETTDMRVNTKEILDCGFFIKNGDNPNVYLSKRERSGNSVTYTFVGTVNDGETLEMPFVVPDSKESRVIWVYEDKWYGFCVFGDTTDAEV